MSGAPSDAFEDSQEFDIHIGPGVYPWPTDLELSFKLHIPKRVIAQILERFPNRLAYLEFEDFEVKVRYSGHLPVALVSPVNGRVGSGSDLIILIREYLKRFDTGEGKVSLETLGPTPFHADFFIEASDDTGHEVIECYGYNQIFIHCDRDSDLRSVLHEKIFVLSEEIGLFYALEQIRNSQMLARMESDEKLEDHINSL